MYQMYMPIAKELYEKINEKRTNGAFEAYGDVTEQEDYENYMFEAFSRFTTSQTIGFEGGEANIGYALINCLKSIDNQLAEKLEQKLNRMYSRCKVTGKTEEICQRYFHYGKSHVENTMELIDRYHKSLKDISESKLDKDILGLLPTIGMLLQSDKHSVPNTQNFIDKLENANFDLTSFCDNIETKMQKSFVKSLNKDTQRTIEEMQANPSKLKRIDGQDFNLIIHSSLTPEEFIQNQGSEYHNILSTSLIDNKNVRCYQSGNVKFAFYQPIEQDNLISAFSGDASTTFSDEGVLTSFSVPDYVPTKDFKSKTREGHGISGYSEIMLKGNVRPNAIVCFDYVTEHEMELAEKHDLDLILIETECYKDMLMDVKRDERYIRKADLSKYETEIKL